jgi:division protein CdvB (Snf7/Vps24/ESCRT-III family)
MNVKQALKQKNKLVTDLKAQYQILQKFNSIEEGNPRRYIMVDALAKIASLSNELVELKARIHKVNQPVYNQIFLLAELKGQIKELKKVPTDEGKQTERYGSVQSIKVVELNIVDVENRVGELQDRIEELQNELDIHNANTII